MSKSTDIVTCPLCKEQVVWKDIREHRRTRHPEAVAAAKAAYASSRTAKPVSPLDAIRSFERQIQECLRDLETERDQLHARIIEIDNTVAAYRKK